MKRHPHELPIPEPAPGDERAYELLRLWDSGATQQVSLSPMLWDDPGNWGIALRDLAKLIADAYGKSGKMDSVAALELVKKGFEAEWNMATDTPRGQLLE